MLSAFGWHPTKIKCGLTRSCSDDVVFLPTVGHYNLFQLGVYKAV